MFGTDSTKNPLHQDGQYENITVFRELDIPDFELLEKIENNLQPENQQADCILFNLCSYIHYRSFGVFYTLHYNALLIEKFEMSTNSMCLFFNT